MKSLIFLDDERNLDDVTWIEYPDYKEVFVFRRMCDFMFAVMHIEDLENYDFSFDHDIQDFSSGDIENTGYDCVKWLCDFAMDNKVDLSLNKFYYHTQNPVGNKNMKSYIDNYLKFCREN
jgi:hypothetical protein